MNAYRLTTRVAHPMNSLLCGIVVAVGGLWTFAAHLGCSAAAPRVLNAVEIAEWTLPYGVELDLCRIEAKKLPRGERFESYVRCEEEATRKTCARLGASARAHWNQCEAKIP